MEPKIRILIADDQMLFAHMLKTVLETRASDFEVVGLAKNGHEALEMATALKPDVLLLDLSMPELDGVQTARELQRRKDPVRVIVLTTFDEPGPLREVLATGVGGYVLKDCEPQELFSSIRAVHSGATSLSAGVIKHLVPPSSQDEPGPRHDSHLERLLNRREQEILVLVADGLSNKEIGHRLFIAEQTIKNNISSIYDKLGIHDRAKLIKVAETFVKSRG